MKPEWRTGEFGLPVERYIDKGFAALEADRLWARTWQMACRVEQLQNPGDYLVYDMLDQSIVIVLAGNGAIKAYHNVCPHRATALTVGSGRFQLGTITCPFHGLKWDLDGNNTFIRDRSEFMNECLIPHGTEEQRLKYLPGVSQGVVWCQGLSEPGAGSDLASLRCRAERDDDTFVVNGQKIWSSKSMYAQYCILLARTDPAAPKHAGISYFIMDMKSPGVEVRPIRQANGRAEFGELFLTDVRIPAENLVGAENNGWLVAQATLSSERGLIAFEGAERRRYVVERFLRNAVRENAAWLNDSELRREFLTLLTDMQANRRMIRALFDEHSAAGSHSVMAAPLVKLVNTELRQRIACFGVQVAGIDGQRLEKSTEDAIDSWMFDYITSLGGKIAGGSNEIMRNIVAERGLGMQKEGR